MEKIFQQDFETKFNNPKEVKTITISLADIDKDSDVSDVIKKLLDDNSKIYSGYDIARTYNPDNYSPIYTLLLYR